MAYTALPTNVTAEDSLVWDGSTWARLRRNLTATSDPSASNDQSQGYRVGSQWYNTVSRAMFLCKDATVGAAVWFALGALGYVTVPAMGLANSSSVVAFASSPYYTTSTSGSLV